MARTLSISTMRLFICLACAMGGEGAVAEEVAGIPPVHLTRDHEALCEVKVGDALPAIELPQGNNEPVRRLADLYGERLTVVLFWKGDRHMSRMALGDLQRDVAERHRDHGVSVVGIAVEQPADSIHEIMQRTGADFPTLLDSDGSAFATVGQEKLPRIYLVDSQGKILWFDIEYSLATRRELNQSLRALAGPP